MRGPPRRSLAKPPPALTLAIWRRIFRHMAARVTPPSALDALQVLLGGKAVFLQPLQSRLDLVPFVREGLPYAALEAIGAHLHLSVEATAKSLGLSARTLARRKEAGQLDAVESERVVRLAEVAARAADVFGSDESARTWLDEPNRALGGAKPLAMLDTDMGAEAVRDVLGRIEYGVFS
jgi:putative toxin-antitoxin system antitoxin component (TIGR02293 family)